MAGRLGRPRSWWRDLAPRERASLLGMAGFVLALNVVGWGTLLLIVAPQHYQVSGSTIFGVGLGVTAFTLGMRHAFDADHIAAIDNTTRTLMADGQRPMSVGFWFSLGHSSVVFGLCVLLTVGVRALAGQLEDDTSTLHDVTGLVGTAVSGVFLLTIGLLVLAGGAAAVALPWYAILTLPVLFAAGMSLLDTIDGCFMNVAYGWAFSRPVRKVYYNLTVTALGVFVALVIGGIEIVSIVDDRLGIDDGVLGWVGALDLNLVGFVIVGVFVVTWLAALAVWRFGRIEERWEQGRSGVAPELEERLEAGLDLTLDDDLIGEGART